MINIFTAYKNGLVIAWKEKKMLFWLYGFNLLFAYLVTLPITMMFSKALDNTLAADKVLDAFDLTIFITIFNEFGKGIHLGRMITTIGVLYLIVNIFFSGGILRVFADDKRFTVRVFFDGCINYFKRFLKLFLFSLLFIAIAILSYLALSGISSIITDNATTEHLPIIFFLLKILIVGMILAVMNMLIDYARIMTVVNDFHGMYQTLKQSLMFVLMSPRKTTLLYFLYVFTFIIFLCVYLLVESFIKVNSTATVIIFFLWTQLFILSRIWIRMSFFAGQYSFYHHSNTAMPGMTKEMLENAVSDYEKRADEQIKAKPEATNGS
jgi:hypothetical protein